MQTKEKTIITLSQNSAPSLNLWSPIIGENTIDFITKKFGKDIDISNHTVVMEALKILGQCLPPKNETTDKESKTGLVLGYVQSGKTLSFETVMALARDNGFGMVVLFTGTKNNLQQQSEKRIIQDLEIEDSEEWISFTNPNQSSINTIKTKITAWKRRPSKQSLFISVLKHHSRIDCLADIFSNLGDLLENFPVLIIDDEGDQASLNTKASQNLKKNLDDTSTTYETILKFRQSLYSHTYLQYTATPQSNLLLNKADLLNPDFTVVLSVGAGYIGGKHFFLGASDKVKLIPASDIYSDEENALQMPPATLIESIKTFILIAAEHASKYTKKSKDRNRSMMIHPAVKTEYHKIYKSFAESVYGSIKSGLEFKNVSLENKMEIFKKEYDELAKTSKSISALETLIDCMEDVFDSLHIVEANSTPEAEANIKWGSSRYWILVGGAKLDRGYTVEGLCVTYMPRSLGSKPNADNLQQRARFFGYKSSYFDLCRVYLPLDVFDAFKDYVEHEEHIRESLIEHQDKPLREWSRVFFISAALNPTRKNVVGRHTHSLKIPSWFSPITFDMKHLVSHKDNDRTIKSALKKWRQDSIVKIDAFYLIGKKRTEQVNVLVNVPLKEAIDLILSQFILENSYESAALKAYISIFLEILKKDPDLKTSIFLMGEGYRTIRNINESNQKGSVQYFSNSSGGSVKDKDYYYEKVSIQLRRLSLGKTKGDNLNPQFPDIPWLAIYIDETLRKDFFIGD